MSNETIQFSPSPHSVCEGWHARFSIPTGFYNDPNQNVLVVLKRWHLGAILAVISLVFFGLGILVCG